MITLSMSTQSPELDDMMAQATLSQEHLESGTVELQSNAQHYFLHTKRKEVSYLLVTNVKPWPHFICMADDSFACK